MGWSSYFSLQSHHVSVDSTAFDQKKSKSRRSSVEMRRLPPVDALKPQAASARCKLPHRPHQRHLKVHHSWPYLGQISATTSPPSLPSHAAFRRCMLATRLPNPSLPSGVMASAYSVHHGAPSFTITALGRWSVINKQLPGTFAYTRRIMRLTGHSC